jgi:hypothetical protein
MATLRYWNDDDRKNDYITYYDNKEEEHVPVYKILKEMYDEDKANLYIYDSEEEYIYKYGECYFENYIKYSYDYNEFYPMSPSQSSQSDDLIVSDNNGESDVDYDNDTIVDVSVHIEKDVKEQDDEQSIVTSNKFIYT